MANLKLYRGAKSSIPSAKEDGALYVASDTHEVFLDINSSTRIQLTNVVTVADMTALASITNPIENTFYYVTAKNAFYKKISSTWKSLGSTLTGLVVGASASATSDAAASGPIYLNLIYDGEVVSSHKITSSGSAGVTCNANGEINIHATGSGGGGGNSTIYNDTEPDPVSSSMSIGDVWINKTLTTS